MTEFSQEQLDCITILKRELAKTGFEDRFDDLIAQISMNHQNELIEATDRMYDMAYKEGVEDGFDKCERQYEKLSASEILEVFGLPTDSVEDSEVNPDVT